MMTILLPNASPRTKGSSIIWRIFIEFEIRFGTSKRAKMVLFRALGDCPLVKGFRFSSRVDLKLLKLFHRVLSTRVWAASDSLHR